MSIGLMPMSDARRDGTPVLAKFRSDLGVLTGRPDDHNIKYTAGKWAVVSSQHPRKDGLYDIGWNLDGPFGMGGFPDVWFEGFSPLPGDSSYQDK